MFIYQELNFNMYCRYTYILYIYIYISGFKYDMINKYMIAIELKKTVSASSNDTVFILMVRVLGPKRLNCLSSWGGVKTQIFLNTTEVCLGRGSNIRLSPT